MSSRYHGYDVLSSARELLRVVISRVKRHLQPNYVSYTYDTESCVIVYYDIYHMYTLCLFDLVASMLCVVSGRDRRVPELPMSTRGRVCGRAGSVYV